MAERRRMEFFVLRYVPNVVREEFVNIGVVLTESGNQGDFAGIHFTADWRRVHCLDPNADIEMLQALGRDMETRLKDAHQRQRLLQDISDSYSNAIQVSGTRRCITDDPAEEMKKLAQEMVEMSPAMWKAEPRASTGDKTIGRRFIHAQMGDAFREAGVWEFLVKGLAASTYTNPNDDFVFDFAYPFKDQLRIFHAVSLAAMGPESRMFPLKVMQVAPKLRAQRHILPVFTAVVEDKFDEENKAVRSVLAFMHEENIEVARLHRMPDIAENARLELGV